MDERDLLLRINAFLVKHDMAQSAIGRAALKDPNFYARLAGGRSVSFRVANKVIQYMANFERKPNAAPAR